MSVHTFDIFNIFDIFEISPGGAGFSPSPTTPKWQANVPNPDTGFMDDVAIGVGGLTEIRAGELWARDFEGIYREFPAQVPARSGGRVVTNIVESPNDIQGTGWSTRGSTTTLDAVTANFPAIGYANRLVCVVPAAQSSNAHVMRQTVTADQDVGVQFTVLQTGAGAYAINRTLQFVAGVPQIITFDWVLDPAYGPNFALTVSVSVADTTLTIEDTLVQDVAGASNTDIPPEFVVGTKVSAHYNGNSVTDNVVTESLGALLPETPRLVHQPEATNTFLNNYTPVTQTITAPTGTHTCWIEGTGSVTLSGGLTGTVTDGSPVTGDPAGVDVLCTVSGTPDFAMFEDNAAPTAPIPTGASPETRPTCDLSFDVANHDEARGAYYFECDWPFSSAGASNTAPIPLYFGVSYLRMHAVSNTFRSQDGTALSVVNTPLVSGFQAFGYVYDAVPLLRSTYTSAGSNKDDAFDGAMDASFFKLASFTDFPMSFGVIERYDVDYETGKALIEEKLA